MELNFELEFVVMVDVCFLSVDEGVMINFSLGFSFMLILDFYGNNFR